MTECQYAEDMGMPEYRCVVRCVYEEKGFSDAIEQAARVAERYDDTDTLTAPKAIAASIRALASLRSTIPTADSVSPGRNRLDQIERGLDGVTPGEWLNEGSAIYALDEGGMVNRFYAGVQGGFVKNRRHGAVRTSEAELKANAAHIARCDPDTMREIAAYVRDLEERLATATQALEDILAPIAKAQRELEPGQRLSGMAYSILTSAENLREIARTALYQIRSQK